MYSDGIAAIGGGQLPGAGQQGVVRHHLDHEAPVACRLGIDEVAGEAHPAGPVDPDELGQADGQAATGHDPDAGMGVGEARPFRRDEEVAGQGQLQPAGHGRSVDGADDRRPVRHQHAEVRDRVAHAVPLDRPLLGRQRLQVDAGAERGVGPRQHHAAHVLASVEVGDGGVELALQLGRQRVARLGAVQGDRGHPVVHLDEHQHQHPSLAVVIFMIGRRVAGTNRPPATPLGVERSSPHTRGSLAEPSSAGGSDGPGSCLAGAAVGSHSPTRCRRA